MAARRFKSKVDRWIYLLMITVIVVQIIAVGSAALQAAWVWLGENGGPTPIEEVVEPFVILDETRRALPRREYLDTYRRQKRLFEALSRRLRGLEARDPFDARADLLFRSAHT